MSEALEVRISALERNNTSLWDKHDQCEEERKTQAVRTTKLQGQSDLLANKIDNIVESTSKTEAAVMRIGDTVDSLLISNAQKSGFAIGAKEIILGGFTILAAIATVAAIFL